MLTRALEQERLSIEFTFRQITCNFVASEKRYRWLQELWNSAHERVNLIEYFVNAHYTESAAESKSS